MTVYENGHRFMNYDKFEYHNQKPYNYSKYGLVNHMLSKKIIESKNQPLKIILNFVDRSFVQLLHYVDELKYFKNYLWKNR